MTLNTFNPKDLSIVLEAVSNPQHVLNGGPKGATFPGWFLTVQQNEGYDSVFGPRQLAFAEVSQVTDFLDRMLGRNYPITTAADRCQVAMRDSLQQQLDAAEKAAARIPELRKLLGKTEA